MPEEIQPTVDKITVLEKEIRKDLEEENPAAIIIQQLNKIIELLSK